MELGFRHEGSKGSYTFFAWLEAPGDGGQKEKKLGSRRTLKGLADIEKAVGFWKAEHGVGDDLATDLKRRLTNLIKAYLGLSKSSGIEAHSTVFSAGGGVMGPVVHRFKTKPPGRDLPPVKPVPGLPYKG